MKLTWTKVIKSWQILKRFQFFGLYLCKICNFSTMEYLIDVLIFDNPTSGNNLQNVVHFDVFIVILLSLDLNEQIFNILVFHPYFDVHISCSTLIFRPEGILHCLLITWIFFHLFCLLPKQVNNSLTHVYCAEKGSLA